MTKKIWFKNLITKYENSEIGKKYLQMDWTYDQSTLHKVHHRQWYRPACPRSCDTLSPNKSAPTILKNRAPALLFENRSSSFLQKTGSFSIHKEKRPGCLFSFWITTTLFFCTLLFSKNRVPNFKKAGCPIFKNSGCRLTGRVTLEYFNIKE